MWWLWGCFTQEPMKREHPSQSIDVFVENKRVDSGQAIILVIDIYQDHGWTHEPLLVSSETLSAQWQKTEENDLGSGMQRLYTYHLSGNDGSHIIKGIDLIGLGPEGEKSVSTSDIFVDIGGKPVSTSLRGLADREEDSVWHWWVISLGSIGLLWYTRRNKLVYSPPTLEETYRSQWGIFVQKELDAQKRAIRLSSLLREYLSKRFSVDLLHSSPSESIQIIRKQTLPKPVRNAIERIFTETDAIRFAGIDVQDDIFTELGRSLEVIFSVGNSQ